MLFDVRSLLHVARVLRNSSFFCVVTRSENEEHRLMKVWSFQNFSRRYSLLFSLSFIKRETFIPSCFSFFSLKGQREKRGRDSNKILYFSLIAAHTWQVFSKDVVPSFTFLVKNEAFFLREKTFFNGLLGPRTPDNFLLCYTFQMSKWR